MMSSPRTALFFLLFHFAVLSAGASQCPAADPQYIRLAGNAHERTLKTAVRQYVHPAGVQLTLINTVHLAEPEYFLSFAGLLADSDAIIVEGVKRSRSPVRIKSTSTFGLVSQSQNLKLPQRAETADLDELSFDAIAPAVSSVTVAMPSSRMELATGLASIDTDPRVLVACEMAYAIRQRNAVAITAVRHALARGERHITLIYGAAHGPDLNARLTGLGFTLETVSWLNAFTVGQNP